MLKWQNLKNNRCAKCNKDFAVGLTVESNMTDTMFTHRCGFKISERMFNKIVLGVVRRDEYKSYDDSLAALNNLK